MSRGEEPSTSKFPAPPKGETSTKLQVSKKGNNSKPRLTHFLSLPVGHHDALNKRWSEISAALLASSPPIHGLHDSIIIKPGSLHVTLGVLSLASGKRRSTPQSVGIAEEVANLEDTLKNPVPDTTQTLPPPSAPKHTVDDAIQLLKTLQDPLSKILGKKGDLMVPLHRMDVMRNKPNQKLDQSHVMWAGPDPDSDEGKRLAEVCDLIHRTFNDAGMLVDDRPLKLHCTLINTVYRKEKSKEKKLKKRWNQRVPFSFEGVIKSPAFSNILKEEFEGAGEPLKIDLGSWSVKELQLCLMGKKDPETGVYQSVGAISLR